MKNLNKNINGKDLNGFALSLRKDGQTYRKGDTTAYSNVGVDIATGQFLALVTMDDRRRKLSGKKKEACLHLSIHATILEAAYAASVFHADLDNNLRALRGKPNRTYDCGPIPAFEYAAIDTDAHIAYRSGLRAKLDARMAMKKSPSKTAAKFAEAESVMVDSRDGRQALLKKYGSEVFTQLTRKYGQDSVNAAINSLTVHEFEGLYGLTSIVDIRRLEMHRGPFNRARA